MANFPEDITNIPTAPTLGLGIEEIIPSVPNKIVDVDSGEIPIVMPKFSSTSFRKTDSSTQKIKSSTTDKDEDFDINVLDQDLIEQTDQLSENILGNDSISDPEVPTVSTTTTMTVKQIDNTNIGHVPEVDMNETPHQTPVEEEKIVLQNMHLAQTDNPVEEKKDTPKEHAQVVQLDQQPATKKETINPVQITQNSVVKPSQRSVVTKPISIEDEDIQLDFRASGKQEIKPVEVGLESVAFEPFNPNTPDTMRTDEDAASIIIPNVTEDTFQKFIEKIEGIAKTKDKEAIRNIRLKNEDPKTYEHRLLKSAEFNTDRQASEKDALKAAIDNNHKVVSSVDLDGETYRDKKTSQSQLNRFENGSIVASNDSFPLAMALLGGIRKVHFYNSGFWVVVRPPLISELHTYYTRCDQSSAMYGKLFGQLAYLPADVEIVRAGLDLFKSCVVTSNLENCKVDNTLERCLSSQDEDTYLWAMASLMFPEGATAEYVCANDNCHYIDRATIDISQMRFFDYTRLGVEAIKYCHSSEKRTETDIANYKDNILKTTKAFPLDTEWSVHIADPSMFDKLESKSMFVDDMRNVLELDAFGDIDDYIKARYYKILAPWINKISFTRSSDGKKVFFEDRDAVNRITEALQLRISSLPQAVTDHIKNTKISYYCYSYNACPKCNKVPETEINGLIPCDMQQSFFSLTTEVLK